MVKAFQATCVLSCRLAMLGVWMLQVQDCLSSVSLHVSFSVSVCASRGP